MAFTQNIVDSIGLQTNVNALSFGAVIQKLENNDAYLKNVIENIGFDFSTNLYNDLNFQAQDSAFTADNNTLYLNSNNELTWKNNSGTEQNLTSPPGIFNTIDVNTIDDKDDAGITITSDVTIQGDLTVGTWNATTITDTDITDNIIVLNKGETGAGVTVTGNRSGIEIDRGTASNAALLWDDSNDKWLVNTGTTSTYYEIWHAGNFTAGNYLPLSGGTMTGNITMSNGNITGVNHIEINDPGAGEGISWVGGNKWKIYESPNALTNASGNLQIVTDATRLFTFNTSGQLEIPVATGTAPFVISSTTKVTNLNADLLDGYTLTSAPTASTVVARDSSGDLRCRLVRSEYTSTNASVNYIMTQGAVGTTASGANNYIRPSTPTQVAAALSGEAMDIAGNATTASTLFIPRAINGVNFNGAQNITINANTPNTLTRGSYLTGSNFNGSAATTWAVDATSANTASKVVARDSSGNFSAGTITASLSGSATQVGGYAHTQLSKTVMTYSATKGPGWLTVCKSQAGTASMRAHNEIIVSDADSNDHAFIRLHWMRSYADSKVTVLNCGGHAARITKVRVLEDTSGVSTNSSPPITYGNKYLQVYVTVSSNYTVNIRDLGASGGFANFMNYGPIIENSKSGYSVDTGSLLEDLGTHYSLASSNGILTTGGIKGGNLVVNDAFSNTSGSIQLTGSNGNWISWNSNGVNPPTYTNRSAGTKLVLYPNITSTQGDYALGIESGTLWYSVPSLSHTHKWYAGTNLMMSLVNKNLNVVGSITTGTGLVSSSGGITINNGGEIAFNDASRYWLKTATNWGIYWNTSTNKIEFHGAGTNRWNVDLDDGNQIMSGDLYVNGGNVYTGTAQQRVKLSVWDSTNFGIGMQNSYTFGSLNNDYAMTFQMNDDADRGFWWGHAGHTNAQGAMSLNTDGQLTVADSIRVGYGESDTTAHTAYAMDINGSLKSANFIATAEVTYGTKLQGVSSISFLRGDVGGWTSAAHHGIRSVNLSGNWDDDISINSYHDIILRLDSNNNNTDGYLRIMQNSTGNSQTHYFGYNGSVNLSYLGNNVGINASPKTNSTRLYVNGDSEISGNVEISGNLTVGGSTVGGAGGGNTPSQSFLNSGNFKSYNFENFSEWGSTTTARRATYATGISVWKDRYVILGNINSGDTNNDAYLKIFDLETETMHTLNTHSGSTVYLERPSVLQNLDGSPCTTDENNFIIASQHTYINKSRKKIGKVTATDSNPSNWTISYYGDSPYTTHSRYPTTNNSYPSSGSNDYRGYKVAHNAVLKGSKIYSIAYYQYYSNKYIAKLLSFDTSNNTIAETDILSLIEGSGWDLCFGLYHLDFYGTDRNPDRYLALALQDSSKRRGVGVYDITSNHIETTVQYNTLRGTSAWSNQYVSGPVLPNGDIIICPPKAATSSTDATVGIYNLNPNSAGFLEVDLKQGHGADHDWTTSAFDYPEFFCDSKTFSTYSYNYNSTNSVPQTFDTSTLSAKQFTRGNIGGHTSNVSFGSGDAFITIFCPKPLADGRRIVLQYRYDVSYSTTNNGRVRYSDKILSIFKPER